MKPQIISRQEIIEEDGRKTQVTRWYFSQDGIHEIKLENLLEDSVTDCSWLDDKETVLLVSYSNSDSSELLALVSPKGRILRKGISTQEKYFENLGLTKISVTSYSLGEERHLYCFKNKGQKMAIINNQGDFIIKPIFDIIDFEEEENCFYAKNYGGEFICYSVEGKLINNLMGIR